MCYVLVCYMLPSFILLLHLVILIFNKSSYHSFIHPKKGVETVLITRNECKFSCRSQWQ